MCDQSNACTVRPISATRSTAEYLRALSQERQHTTVESAGTLGQGVEVRREHARLSHRAIRCWTELGPSVRREEGRVCKGGEQARGAVVCNTQVDTTTSPRRPPGTRMCCFSLDCFPERERRSGERSASADQRRQVKQSRCLLNRQGGRWGLRPMGSRHEAVISMFMCRAHSRFVERAHASQTGRGRGRRPPFLWARSRSCRSRRAVVVCPFLLLLGSST